MTIRSNILKEDVKQKKQKILEMIQNKNRIKNIETNNNNNNNNNNDNKLKKKEKKK